MHEYLIALGANLGDREYYIQKAIEAIRTSCGPIPCCSPLVETEAMGAAEHPFLNAALICTSDFEPEAILSRLLQIEISLGRVRTVHWGDRKIDLDIILWKNNDGSFPSLVSPSLTIPHPHMHERLFVLEPAVAVASTWLHGKLQKTVRELLDELKSGRKTKI